DPIHAALPSAAEPATEEVAVEMPHPAAEVTFAERNRDPRPNYDVFRRLGLTDEETNVLARELTREIRPFRAVRD
uniref:hypothetical protein n=1 Tax=Proteus mirabilis TaxID=584 RepID=UPI0013D3AFC5